ncbi:rab3 GTPase-activating protein catalytic subunit domain-containing protein [Ditylenchus destructor]|uniref:Rab3 GTPase-activating protein catalytic subunit n=1 Tax=Ditylenchus destructor TaxID=166010 RepID=A0AAD4NGG2_9BILA|nr:rab3 GTPase-activating protein catalytic subunit domain-containing protein [Ditylenchus destructor]
MPETGFAKPSVIEADDDIFEINDFTVVTEFESFIASLEVYFSEFSKNKEERQQSPKIFSYKGVEFVFSYHSPSTDVDYLENLKHLSNSAHELASAKLDFAESPEISRQFGVSEYLFLKPVHQNATINDEDMLNMVLSALNIATLNCDCELPTFVQFGDDHRQLYAGVLQNRNARTCFEDAHLQSVLYKHKYLDGIVEMFKEKINTPLNLEHGIGISVCLHYVHKKGSPTPSEVAIHDNDANKNAKTCNHRYPFGADLDPMSEFTLSVCWINVKKSVLTENESYSDLEPSTSAKWFASSTFHSDSKYGLSSMLSDVLDCVEGSCSDCTVFSFCSNNPFNASLDPSANSAASILTPLTHSFGPTAVNFLPASVKNEEVFEECVQSWQTETSPDETPAELNSCKSAPTRSITCQVTVCLMETLVQSPRELNKFGSLWRKFCTIMRECWESNLDLPGAMFKENNYISADEEFFDAKESFEEYTAKGRHQPLSPKTYLLNVNVEIYVPLTQDRGPMTEDMIDEHTSFLTSLEEGEERARAQSDSLLSDMCAFKAANPGCVFEDFVRWHSPRDWVCNEDDDRKGHLSERMDSSGFWKSSWDSARPIPVFGQSRLFNEVKTAEQILQTFDSIKMRQLIDLLLPVVLTESTVTLMRKGEICKSLFEDDLSQLCRKVSRFTRYLNTEDVYEIRTDIERIETMIARFSSLKSFLSKHEQSYLSNEMNSEREINAENWPIAEQLDQMLNTLICGMLRTSSKDLPRHSKRIRIDDAPRGPLAIAIQKSICLPLDSSGTLLPKPSRKEYILRWITPRPGPDSRVMPQRMYVSASEDDGYRFCGSFSSDLTFS